ncbi:mannose-1-phosphate guanylyltransferase (GDP) [Malonomonas rubra DSM 5091]|uniref:mannose-1-phosphate guanylyltransferase n=1 Tax=Malonomonas rubra DSM 5091 TaxID=1122189 RepID=A0A1M6KB09_MALRU|nr:mannose-1-phosphate guanylyltransferase/mannose-6-phosphate isomerase [Malonomonas rubra]SHJ56092.1 mannose-1-phosphate guanylyltransferase (GDP) [Malonomonas rubra DSM 5091]
MLLPVVLSGGAGTRLWPLSRESYPKQLLPLTSDKTMLQETVLRLSGIADLGKPMVVCNEAHRFMVAEQLRQLDIGTDSIILEPCGRNTAPAVAIAAFQAQASGNDPLLLVLPADHLIGDVATFCQTVNAAVQLAEQGSLVTFGIVPNAPETGYGYIKAAENEIGGTGAFPVDQFVEKPDLQTAQSYLDSGKYYWNSGMFLFKASRYLDELEKFRPDIFSACRTAFLSLTADLDFLRLDQESFAASPSDSIDYAVMEKTADAVVLPLDAGWNDVGAWSALWDVQPQDKNGNVQFGDVLTEGANNCYLHATNRMIAAVGVEDLVVVETADAVLVAHRDKVQDVKGIVGQLKEQKRSEALLHRRVNRPWGAYEGIDVGERFQVKRITVNPGASLSLQKHHHRAEHWVVVKGTARVICGEKDLLLSENQSTYIPLGEVHRLENPGQIPLEMIEVQSGSYLGEDDIVRLEDNYGRKAD